MIIQLPEDVRTIIRKLTEYGYEAYAVGGCVRDSIIHRVPGDWDITTSAKPWEVKALFRRTIDTGIAHGTVTVMLGDSGYEVTTYRIDGEYEDSRHPKSVEFTALLSEDLCRRDFTINAMAYNEEEGLVDLFGGREDLEAGIIRCVGEARERFTEDALRMLRAVRFSAQLGYSIETKTCEAIRELAPAISKISKERIHTELNKILMSKHPEYLRVVKELGIAEVAFKAAVQIDNFDEAMELLKIVPQEISYKYAAVLYGVGHTEAARQLRELKLDNNTIDLASALIRMHGMEVTEDVVTIRKQASQYGVLLYAKALEFEKLFYRVRNDTVNENTIVKQQEIFEEILKRGDCLTIKELDVNGEDLMDNGVPQGTELGRILKEMLEDVLEHPENNKKEYLLANHLHI